MTDCLLCAVFQPGECRRRHLAEHFEEPWTSDLCPKACDVCTNPSETTTIDVSDIVRVMLKIIREVGDVLLLSFNRPLRICNAY